MKKITAVILVLCLCFCFTGCGEEEVVSEPSSSIASGPSVFDFGATQSSGSKNNAASQTESTNNKGDGSKVSLGQSDGGDTMRDVIDDTNQTVKDPIPANAPRIICWGDSITSGMGMSREAAYPGVLQKLLGNKYRVLNAGSSGEQAATIAARQGAYDVTFDRDLVFKSGYGDVYLDGVNGPNLILTDGTVLDINEDGEAFNNNLPCEKVYIDGKEYQLKARDKKIKILREDCGKQLVIKKGTKIVFDSAKKQQGSYCEIFYIGANDESKGIKVETLVERYKAMAKRQGSNRYIVILPQWSTKYHEALKAEFGDKALDIKEEMCKIDPQEFGFRVSESDRQRMREGKLPLLYLYEGKASESLHLSQSGYYAMATVIFRHGKNLGYW